MELTSIDYAEFMRLVAYKYYKILLNKTQINKLLFIVYGNFLSKQNHKLFNDDTPKAWPYGPVFPIVNKKIDIERTPSPLPEEKVKLFMQNTKALDIIIEVVEKYHNCSAFKLTSWSHQKNSPWYDTLFKDGEENNIKWNKEISDDLIKDYFLRWHGDINQ